MEQENYFEKLHNKMDDYAHDVCRASRKFPKEELYGVTSQIRRSSLSVVLNYIEGYARYKKAVKKNFWEISYGSLKESEYLLHFSYREGYLSNEEYKELVDSSNEIGAMLWRAIQSLR